MLKKKFKKGFGMFAYFLLVTSILSLLIIALKNYNQNIDKIKEKQKILNSTQYQTGLTFSRSIVSAYCFGPKNNMTKNNFNNYTGTINFPSNSNNHGIVYIIQENLTETECNLNKNNIKLLGFENIKYICKNCQNKNILEEIDITVDGKELKTVYNLTF